MAFYQPSTPFAAHSSTSHLPSGSAASIHSANSTATTHSAVSSNNTFVLSNSPMKLKKDHTSYKPQVHKTQGQRPACLVNASVTYCGNDTVIGFGGFDQYTDEVYNHVLKLDLRTQSWALVENHGAIPGVRMGHTATLYNDNQLIIFGGENEGRTFLHEVVILNLETFNWTVPVINGPFPRGRSRHAAVIHDDKLFISGGMSSESEVLDDLVYLDLKTWTWSRRWTFVGRFDHKIWVWNQRLYIFGGLGKSMEKPNEVYWLDFKDSLMFEQTAQRGRYKNSSRGRYNDLTKTLGGTPEFGYATQSGLESIRRAPTPGAIVKSRFLSNKAIPVQTSGTHFHVVSSGCLLDFTTPAITTKLSDCGLSSLELDSFRWRRMVESAELFEPSYQWCYSVIDDDGTRVWLIGCPSPDEDFSTEEYLSHILEIDLRRYGLVGNSFVSNMAGNSGQLPNSKNLTALGADFSTLFGQDPGEESGTDFTVTALKDDDQDIELSDADSIPSIRLGRKGISVGTHENSAAETTSAPIHVHKFILKARWPHFNRVLRSQMQEFHSKRMHIPEPYPVVRAFLYYLYTDSISTPSEGCPDVETVAGLLVMANLYDMPRLRSLCVHRLSKELDVENAATVWERAGVAGEEWLRRKAASFCMSNWGRIVRTNSFISLSRSALVELCAEVEPEGQVVAGEESDTAMDNPRGLRVDEVSMRFGATGMQGVAIETDPEDTLDDDDEMS